MRLVIAAVGRLKQGPERELAERYRDRALKAGRSLGIRDIEVVEIADSRAREVERREIEELIALTQALPEGATIIVLDERGTSLDSIGLASQIKRWRDDARPVAFVIGGPDGTAPALRERADLCLAFGKATWPHQLVRIMLLEQIYRAVTVISGHPYHRA